MVLRNGFILFNIIVWISIFPFLNSQKNMKRMVKTLLLVGDTEGGMTRSGKFYSLHEISFAIVGVCEFNRDTSAIGEIKMMNPFSFVSWSAQKNQPVNDMESIRKNLIKPLQYHLEYFECEMALFGFWGAHHDRYMLKNVLVSKYFESKYLDFNKLVKTIDTAERKGHKQLKEYSLNYVMKHYSAKQKVEKNKVKSQTHTAYGDTIDTIKILKCFMQDINHIRPVMSLTKIDEWLKEIYSRPEIPNCVLKEKPKVAPKVLRASKPYTPYVLSSFALASSVLPNYIDMDRMENDYLWSEDKVYKIRKGWKNKKESRYKGFGLYCLSESKTFHLKKNQEEKYEIITNAKII